MQTNKKREAMSAKDIKTVLRLLHGGAATADVAKRTKLGESTVKRWKRRAKRLGLNYEKVKDMSDADLEEKFRKKRGPKPEAHYPVDMVDVVSQLEADMTIQETYEIYQSQGAAAAAAGVAAPLKRSSYFHRVSDYLDEIKTERSYSAQVWDTGGYMLIDLAGTTIKATPDGPDGEIVEYPVYVAIVPATDLIHSVVMADQSAAQWSLAIVASFERYGGIPRHIKCDNAKQLVVDPVRGNQTLSATLQKLRVFFENKFDVEPCRVGEPRDKGPVEWAVKQLTNVKLKKIKLGSVRNIDDAQLVVDIAVDKLNDRVSPTKGVSAQADFNAREARKMQRLPNFRYSPVGRLHRYKVPKPSRMLEFDGHRYLCDYKYKPKEIDVCVGEDNKLHFFNTLTGKEEWEYTHFEYGVADETEGFTHVKDEFRAPNELTADKQLDKQKEKFLELCPSAADYLKKFLNVNRRKGKWGIADRLGWLRKELLKCPKDTLNEALSYACGIGDTDPKIVLCYVKAFSAAAKSNQPKKKPSNRGACLRGKAGLMPVNGGVESANSKECAKTNLKGKPKKAPGSETTTEATA